MITYEQIKKANESIATTDIKGKEYAMVNQRIKAFRMVYPTGFIETEMQGNDGEVCVFKASVGYIDESYGKVILGNGTAFEKASSSFINKTSYIENCETSAVGRALGMAGFGIDTNVASYEEVQTAINNQDKDYTPVKRNKAPDFPDAVATVSETHVTALFKKCESVGVSIEKVLSHYNVSNAGELTIDQWNSAMKKLENNKK